mmetsp:Transcript_10920/g.16385  ORF Transcript_10920/g.16385 Transcript_10920/m.16385 type:complete len:91 (-) Transcript_10920:61-333(-)
MILREKILLSLQRQVLQSPSPPIVISRNQRVKVKAHVARKGASNNALPMNLPRNCGLNTGIKFLESRDRCQLVENAFVARNLCAILIIRH